MLDLLLFLNYVLTQDWLSMTFQSFKFLSVVGIIPVLYLENWIYLIFMITSMPLWLLSVLSRGHPDSSHQSYKLGKKTWTEIMHRKTPKLVNACSFKHASLTKPRACMEFYQMSPHEPPLSPERKSCSETTCVPRFPTSADGSVTIDAVYHLICNC